MDPFKRLPAELRLELLLSVENFREATAFSQSSTTLFSVGNHHFCYIARSLVPRSVPDIDEHLQDYMALILFPSNQESSYSSKRARTQAVEAHLYRWGQGKLPDPVKSGHGRLILALLDAHSRIKQFAEDYLGKATNVCVRRAYRHLPEWAHDDWSQGKSNKQLANEGETYSYDIDRQLNRTQRIRLFRSFLRYELLCKIYGPQRGEVLTVPDQPPRPRFAEDEDDQNYGLPLPCLDPEDPFRGWNWNILERYQGCRTTFDDKRLLTSIREYARTVYVALMQDQMGIPIPSLAQTMPYVWLQDREKLVFHGVYQLTCHEDWDRRHLEQEMSDRVAEFAASTGFDTLTSVLQSGIESFRDFVSRLTEELYDAKPAISNVNIALSLNMPCEWCCRAKGLELRHSLARHKRQTAWALFTDNLVEAEDTTWYYWEQCTHNDVCDLAHNENILHAGGFAVYPSLTPKLVSFWKQHQQ